MFIVTHHFAFPWLACGVATGKAILLLCLLHQLSDECALAHAAWAGDHKGTGIYVRCFIATIGCCTSLGALFSAHHVEGVVRVQSGAAVIVNDG